MLISFKLKKEKEGGFAVLADDLAVFTQGESREEACEMLKDAVELTAEADGFNLTVDIHLTGADSGWIHCSDVAMFYKFILRRLRLKCGKTLEDASKSIKSGASVNAFAQYEKGPSVPGLVKAQELLRAVSTDVNYELAIVPVKKVR